MGYIRTRFRRSTCSRWTILGTVRKFKESGIEFLQIDANWHRQHCGNRRRIEKKKTHDHTIPTPRIARKLLTWNPLYRSRGTYSQNCTIENPRNQISDLHFDEFPDSSDFKCWKTNFKTEVSSYSRCPTFAMLWIKEEKVAKSVDVLMTSQSIYGKYFHDFDMLDAKMASALRKIMSKRRMLRKTTDFYEEGRLLICSTTIFELLALMTQLLTYQIFSMFLCKEVTFRISRQDGTKVYYKQVRYQKKMSWRVCRSWRYETLFKIRLYQLRMNKKLIETEQCHAFKDWRLW